MFNREAFEKALQNELSMHAQPTPVIPEERFNALVTLGERLQAVIAVTDDKKLIEWISYLLHSTNRPGRHSTLNDYVSLSEWGENIEGITEILKKFPHIIKKKLEDVSEPKQNEKLGHAIYDLYQFHYNDITIDENYLEDFLTIMSLLRNSQACYDALDQLEADIQAYADKHSEKLERVDGKWHLPNDGEKHEIVSGFFHQWFIDNGFNTEKYARALAVLDRKKFGEILQEKLPLEDPQISPKHGRWSHAIQQYIVQQFLNNGLIKHNASDLYYYLGLEACKENVNTIFAAWDFIYDQLSWMKNFLRPEYINFSILYAEYKNYLNAHEKDQKTLKHPLLAKTVYLEYKKKKMLLKHYKKIGKSPTEEHESLPNKVVYRFYPPEPGNIAELKAFKRKIKSRIKEYLSTLDAVDQEAALRDFQNLLIEWGRTDNVENAVLAVQQWGETASHEGLKARVQQSIAESDHAASHQATHSWSVTKET